MMGFLEGILSGSSKGPKAPRMSASTDMYDVEPMFEDESAIDQARIWGYKAAKLLMSATLFLGMVALVILDIFLGGFFIHLALTSNQAVGSDLLWDQVIPYGLSTISSAVQIGMWMKLEQHKRAVWKSPMWWLVLGLALVDTWMDVGCVTYRMYGVEEALKLGIPQPVLMSWVFMAILVVAVTLPNERLIAFLAKSPRTHQHKSGQQRPVGPMLSHSKPDELDLMIMDPSSSRAA